MAIYLYVKPASIIIIQFSIISSMLNVQTKTRPVLLGGAQPKKRPVLLGGAFFRIAMGDLGDMQ